MVVINMINGSDYDCNSCSTKFLTRALILPVYSEQKKCLLSQFFEISMSISQINEPIPGMFVLI